MLEYNILRAWLGLMELGIIWVLLRKDIGYLWRFGVVMFASAAMHLAPVHPNSAAWQQFVQVPAYLLIFILTLEATFELFAFLRRRTFLEERGALIAWASVVGLIPVWVCWRWPGDDWYQSVMLVRQYALMWLAAAYLAAWGWLRAMRPIHMEQQVADHGEFWVFWLLISAAHASTTKYGTLWAFMDWQGSYAIWRIVGDFLTLAQICVCCGFMVNLWNWKPDAAAVAPDESPDLRYPEPSQPRRLLHL